ncbi:hypothetical protein [Streptomyces erythrochromogenes]|uniref:hypothetical protein n=1 Tax=Streptomyces erythrochromogenes TaxID=285574 RepID=UPI00369428D5
MDGGQDKRQEPDKSRGCFAGAEQRSCPGLDGATRLHLTVDTATPAGPAGPLQSAIGTPAGIGAHSDEI